jgi:hypothetical protein
MNRIFTFIAFSFTSTSLVALTSACERMPCTSDSDCGDDSVCFIDAEGARCAAISFAASSIPGGTDDARVDVELVDEQGEEADIILREATMSLAPEARAGTIVMRPISVIVTRSPSSAP